MEVRMDGRRSTATLSLFSWTSTEDRRAEVMAPDSWEDRRSSMGAKVTWSIPIMGLCWWWWWSFFSKSVDLAASKGVGMVGSVG